jgi:hypothetical protein
MSTDNRILTDPKHQTNDEWLQGYTHGEHLPSPRPLQRSQEGSENEGKLCGEFAFIGHRTTRQGRVVLDFVHVETGQIAARFFNVDIKKYRSGNGGQFTTRKGNLFRQFWLHTVNEPPRRWCRVHWEMHKLKNISFRGLATHKNTEAGGYWNLEKIRKLP